MAKDTISLSSPGVTIFTDIPKIANVLYKLEMIYPEVAMRYSKKYVAPIVINKFQEIIRQGGSSKPQYSWHYWKRSGPKFVMMKGRKTTFTEGWSGRQGTTYPIHPRSYFKRKIRKKPHSREYALFDTGQLYRSFRILYSLFNSGGGEIALGSPLDKLDAHELGKKAPKRPVIAPVHNWFDTNIPLQKRIMRDIVLEMKREMKKRWR